MLYDGFAEVPMDVFKQVRDMQRQEDIIRRAQRAMDAVRDANRINDLVRDAQRVADVQNLLPAPPPSLSHVNLPTHHATGELAADFRDRLMDWIREFEADLDDETELGAHVVNFGHAFTFHVTSIGYWNPALIAFHGFDDNGGPIQLVQHVSQISVLFTRVQKRSETANRIGFSEPDAQ